MELIVKNRFRATTEPNNISLPHIIISIYTPGDEPCNPNRNENTLDVVRIAVHDLDRDPGEVFRQTYGEAILFNADMAHQIKDCLDLHKPQAVLVHCDAGQSRSAGVAAAIAMFYNGSDMEFWGSGDMYGRRFSPNILVYRLLLEVLMGEKLVKE